MLKRHSKAVQLALTHDIVSMDFTENAPMYHVSIDFLHWGFHPLHCFLSLSNRLKCPASQFDRVLKAGAILRHSVLCSDRQFRMITLSEVMLSG